MSVSNVSASSSEAAFMPSGKTGFGGVIRPVGGGGGGGGPAPIGNGPLGNWGGACKPPPIGAGFELSCGGKLGGVPPPGVAGVKPGPPLACTPPFIGGPPLWPIWGGIGGNGGGGGIFGATGASFRT